MIEQAVEQVDRFRSRQMQGWCRGLLAETYRMDGQIEKAREMAMQGLEISRSVMYPSGIGIAQRTLGRIALTIDVLSEAETLLNESLQTFVTCQRRFEVGRTHLDLAELAHAQGNQETATTHLSTAYAWFKKLQVPKWVEKTEQLAQEHGVTLTEVELEELTEGEA